MGSSLVEKYGPWAVVTGASSGIGKEFAIQLAAAGLNVVLIARREERLLALADELSGKYRILTHTVAIDLTRADAVDVIDSSCGEYDIGLLVNNAGAAHPGAFLKQSTEKRLSVIDLNVKAPVALTYRFANKMVQRKKGGIIFVSSIAAHTGSPYLASYSATKSYLLSFGTALNIELKKHNVDVTTILPGPTSTEMMDMEGVDHTKMPDMFMEPSVVAKVAIKALGNKSFVTPGIMNRIMSFMMSRIFSKGFAQNMFGGMLAKSMDKSLL